MQYTSHYNLMLPEGTDIVNPLVQQNPNFSDIDAAMFANKQSVVGSATELAAGTVHTITRANPDSNVIKFTATSNWTVGDSMVIDSTPVSVYLSDGKTPATGAYIINSEVLLILSGTRVTMIVSAGAVDAGDVPYDNTTSGISASDVQDAIDALASATPRGSVQVTGNGVKTRTDLLSELAELVTFSKLSCQSKFLVGKTVFSIRNYANTNATFYNPAVYSNSMITDAATLSVSSPAYLQAVTDTNGTTFSDGGSVAVASGVVYKIVY